GFAVPQPQIGLDELFDDVGHLVARERRADDAPDACAPAAPLGQIQAVARACLAPAEGDLVPLPAGLVHAEDADVANVVMAAGIDAAGNVQVQFADVVHVIEVVEAALDGLGHGNGHRVGQRAKIAARAGDDVGQQSDVGRG